VPLPISSKIDALATVQCQRHYAVHLIAILAGSLPQDDCLQTSATLQWRTPALTRKRVNDRPETWHTAPQASKSLQDREVKSRAAFSCHNGKSKY
jgi:hypothetical protein